MLSKTQVNQLEKKLFNLNSDKSHVIDFEFTFRPIDNSILIQEPEINSSNDKYLIENLRFRLQKANDEKTNMKMEFELHTSELKDNKSKVSVGRDDN